MTRSAHWLAHALLWLACAFSCTATAGTLLVLSDGSPAYRATAERIGEVIRAARPSLVVRVAEIAEAASAPIDDTTLVVAIGTQAARQMSQFASLKRLICTLLTRSTYFDLPPPAAGAQRSAVFIDQPAYRQLQLIRAALPDRTRLAIVHGAASSDAVDRFAEVARRENMTLVSTRVADAQQLYDALRDVLDENTVLVAVPDPVVYNNYTIQNVLLTAYRSRVPVVAFSPAYVRAGAIAAVYSSPQQIGEQVGRMVLSFIDAPALPPPADPRYFSVATNPHVARSLSIELPAAAQLETRLEAAGSDAP